jgi:hypothetical protein
VFGFITFMAVAKSCLKEDYPFMVITFPYDWGRPVTVESDYIPRFYIEGTYF